MQTITLPSETSLVDYVRRHPRVTITALARAFDQPARFLRPILNQAREKGRVLSAGRTKGTYYWTPTAAERKAARP